MSHSPEPWKAGRSETISSDPDWDVVSRGLIIARASRKDDAERIVACVNACAGLATETLLEVANCRAGKGKACWHQVFDEIVNLAAERRRGAP